MMSVDLGLALRFLSRWGEQGEAMESEGVQA